MIANEFTDNKGVLNQWVTSGQDLTDLVDGKEVTVHHVHDALFLKGITSSIDEVIFLKLYLLFNIKNLSSKPIYHYL